MAVLNRLRLYSQELLTVPLLRQLEAGVSSDFDAVLRNIISSSAYIISGFTININSSTFSSNASQLTINTLSTVIFDASSAQSGTVLPVNGTSADSLNSSFNSKVVGSFSANATNYIAVDFIRTADPNSNSNITLWNDSQTTAVQRSLYTNTLLDYRIYITTTVPTSTQVVIATVQTNSLSVPTLISDNRPLLFRLGTGGTAPNPFNSYSWGQGRSENNWISTSIATNPFVGGDKALLSLKNWMDAVMTSIKEIKGTPYWYSIGSGGGGGSGGFSLLTVAEDANLSYASSTGSMHYNAATTGDLWWDSQIFIRSIISSQFYKIDTISLGSLVMNDGDVQYIALTRYVPLTANVSFSVSPASVPGNVSTAAGGNGAQIISGTAPVFTGMTAGVSGNIGSGDFIKATPDSNESFNQVGFFFDNSGNTTSAASAYYAVINSSYTGSTGSQSAEYSKTFYTGSSITKAPKATVLSNINAGQMYWLAYRDGQLIFTHFFGQMYPGEDRRISDTSSTDVLNYIGSPNESTTFPNYSSTPSSGSISVSSGQVNYNGSVTDNLTTRLAIVSSSAANNAQNKNVFAAGGGTVSNASGLLSWNTSITLLIGGPISPTGTPLTNYLPAGSVNLSGTNYQSAYVTINRNSSVSLTLSVTSSDNLPLGDNVYTLFRNFVTADIYCGLDGESFLIQNNGSSNFGIGPISTNSIGFGTLHKWVQEIPAGNISATNQSFTLALVPFTPSGVLLFRNGLLQTQGSTGDYTISNQQITFTYFLNSGDELVALYPRGNTINYNYQQSFTSPSALTNLITYSPACSSTSSMIVAVDGAIRIPGTDYIATNSTVSFNFTVTTSAIIQLWYTTSGDSLFSFSQQAREAPTNSRAFYSFYQGDLEVNNCTIGFIDSIAQFPINNTVNNTSITVVDYSVASAQVLQFNNAGITTTSTVHIFSR